MISGAPSIEPRREDIPETSVPDFRARYWTLGAVSAVVVSAVTVVNWEGVGVITGPGCVTTIPAGTFKDSGRG